MYAIPGQHDLVNHNLDHLRDTAFWTLVEAGKITYLPPDEIVDVPAQKLRLYGFPWGMPLCSCWDRRHGWLHVAVVHAYCWKTGYAHVGAPNESHVLNRLEFRSYDAVVIGDNHIHWIE